MFNVTIKNKSWFITNKETGKVTRRSTLVAAVKFLIDLEGDITINNVPVKRVDSIVGLYDAMCKVAYKFFK